MLTTMKMSRYFDKKKLGVSLDKTYHKLSTMRMSRYVDQKERGVSSGILPLMVTVVVLWFHSCCQQLHLWSSFERRNTMIVSAFSPSGRIKRYEIADFTRGPRCSTMYDARRTQRRKLALLSPSLSNINTKNELTTSRMETISPSNGTFCHHLQNEDSLLVHNMNNDSSLVIDVLSVPLLRPQTSSEAPDYESNMPFVQTKRLADNEYMLLLSSVVGVLTGLAIVLFKWSIYIVRELSYGDLSPFDSLTATNIPMWLAYMLIPVVGGVAVALLLFTAGPFAPGLQGTIQEVDKETQNADQNKWTDKFITQLGRGLHKATGAVATLGTGNSLGPEGPSVETGVAMSRLAMIIPPPDWLFGELSASNEASRRRILLACGAAAGVSAGFNAPLSGIFFALEIVLPKFAGRTIDLTISIEPIHITALLLSSVISALVTKSFLGNELALRVSPFSLAHPLLELPFFLVLGALSGLLAALFSSFAKTTKSYFQGTAGPVEVQEVMSVMPAFWKPIIGALCCGLVGLVYPQTLFFGYETLNGLFATMSIPTDSAFALLAAKFCTTAVAAASGLVGGTFAPSLFLGGMLGAGFYNVVNDMGQLLQQVVPHNINPMGFELSRLPAYVMVGGASVLAALFRAPLTASLLLFECTRNYDVILPLLASAGVGSLVGDLVEQAMKEKRRDQDTVSWGDLAMPSTLVETSNTNDVNGSTESCGHHTFTMNDINGTIEQECPVAGQNGSR